MSLSKTTLAAIQQAGQALHRATVVVSGAVREEAEHMVTTVASQPFEAEGEQAFSNFRRLARLSQDLQSLEEKLRELYTTASELASPEMDVVAALPHATTRKRADSSADVAEDAVVKPAPVRKARAVSRKAAGRAQAAALTPNDTTLLNWLQANVSRTQWTRLTGTQMAQGSGLPLGSVGISLKKVIASGAVKKGGRGSYKLGA